jgi:shikimate dehydrogenase
VVYALLQEGWRIHVAARRVGQAEELARPLQAPAGDGAWITPVELSTAGLESLMRDTGAGLIVNTTPLGTATERDTSPWPEGIPFPAKAFLYDLVYNPAETALMRAAREAGLAAAGGIGMLIEQALRAFTIWTGCTPPRQAMQQAVHAYFRERTGDQP